jgi:hypothetical protein
MYTESWHLAWMNSAFPVNKSLADGAVRLNAVEVYLLPLAGV